MSKKPGVKKVVQTVAATGFRVEIDGVDAHVQSMSRMSFSPGTDNDDCEPITIQRPVRLGDSLFEDTVRFKSFPDIEIFYVVAGSDVAKRTLEDCEVGDYSECERDAQSELPLCEQLTFTPERVGAIKQLNTKENES